ncbi:hypothetical protein RUM43_008581, partial [Polyplax serrata]
EAEIGRRQTSPLSGITRMEILIENLIKWKRRAFLDFQVHGKDLIYPWNIFIFVYDITNLMRGTRGTLQLGEKRFYEKITTE